MLYAKINNGAVVEYPYQIGKVRQENPGTSFPSEMSDSLLAEYGVFPVALVPPPATTIYERVAEGVPELVNGEWQQQWVITAASPPASISRRQCALQLKALQMITAQEALDMTRSGIPPAAISTYFATLSDDDRVLAEIDFAATDYYRDNPLIAALMTANSMTEQQVDQFFIAAATL